MSKQNIFVILLVFIIVVIVFVIKTKNNTIQPSEEIPTQTEENYEASVFRWFFEEDESLNLDGNHQTNVYLEAKYANDSMVKKLIDTVPGGCSELPDKDIDAVSVSTQVQCYYAGLGYTYKVVKSETAYVVKRKTFEEGIPNQTPPNYSYETILEFSLKN